MLIRANVDNRYMFSEKMIGAFSPLIHGNLTTNVFYVAGFFQADEQLTRLGIKK